MSEPHRAIERALDLVEQRFGLGFGATPPSWARDRVATVLDVQAARHGLSVEVVAERLASDEAALEELMTALRVGETRFYRDRPHWEAIARDVLPRIPRSQTVLALSAGCSTGEEAYTIAMLLAQAGRRHRVLGVDRSPVAIATARTARYAIDTARDLPPAWLARYCDVEGSDLVMRSTLRESVTFEESDLVHRTPRGPFHLVVFKNVLIYLAAPAGESVTKRLVGELATGGLLFPASSEVLRLRAAGLTAVRVCPGVTAFGPP